ncbi:MAG: nicotinate-nucleotide adenylyltransferase [Oceanicaulis sp.]
MTFKGRPAFKTETLAPGMTVGLYGGSFDPPHAGHVHVARSAKKRMGLDRVWWLASPRNPFKDEAPAPMEERLAWIEAAAPEPGMVASDLEAFLPSSRTVHVIAWLQGRYPGVRFVWIMGADGLADLHRWRGWTEIARRVAICVVSRPGSGLKARLSPAARRLARFRLPEGQARALPVTIPGWTYLTEPLHPHASRHMRRPR